MTIARSATVVTPDGPFTVVADDAAVLASGWTDDVASLVALVHPTLRPSDVTPSDVTPDDVTRDETTRDETTHDDAAHEEAAHEEAAHEEAAHEEAAPGGPGTGDVLAAALSAVRAYYAGDLAAPGAVPVRQVSGEFRAHAWDVLRGVAPGEVVTYTQYAERAGRPAAVRAAAGACAMNAAALFVPCHRVLRTDGSLGGFRYGLPIKESLLTRERSLDPEPALF
ncbi:methylated-DNA--[protein]-cysteine S-methyltransferase [Xylanimonas protaetiae]|uniref:Methylated-DNA--[protein]-cysteine S-methyltransferase n=1 Tax=Xylanimonas protaetiae TaxID=2509457 RepID=A0A4P6F3U1_9MICO|nr:methylated-DNA--[protein]-cysteine S-methyltransferase [Xylanimonas protaetiae]QAY69343.1 methylated-DNA--[protein]-cysteine S-methyltransferase [Xylanimonas protaetiae]